MLTQEKLEKFQNIYYILYLLTKKLKTLEERILV